MSSKRRAEKRAGAAAQVANDNRWIHAAAAAGLLALSLVAYASALRAPFHYDDSLTILQDPSVRLQLPVMEVVKRNPFRPLLALGFALNYRASGPNPASYHLVNVLLHALNATLLYVFVLQIVPAGLRKRESAAFFAAAIGLTHPLTTEAVTLVSSRSTLQATAFLLTSVILYLRFCRGGRSLALVASMTAFAAAAMSKEIGGLTPLVIAAAVWLVRPPATRRAWLWLVPAGLLFVAGVAYRAYVFFAIEYRVLPRPILENVLTQLAAFPTYLKLFLWPAGLTIDHDFPVVATVGSAWPWIGLAAAITLAALLIRLRHSSPHIALLLSLALIAHLPTAGLFPLVETMAEHRFYLQTLALAACAVLALWKRMPARPATSILTIVLLAATWATVGRNRVWLSEETLWADAAAKRPHSARSLSNYADALRMKGEYKSAAEQYVRALEVAPGNLDYTVNLGICFANAAMHDEAEAVFQAARKIDPLSPKPLINMGNLRAVRGDYDGARELWEEAIGIAPDSFEARVNLGVLYRDLLGDQERGTALLEEARRIDPVKGQLLDVTPR